MQLVQHGRHGAGEGAGTEVVQHLVPAPGVGATRAAASGKAAVQVVERVVERVVTVQLPVPQSRPTQTGNAWAPLLTELTRQLDTGRIYTRDLNAILPTFDQVLQALNRRLTH